MTTDVRVIFARQSRMQMLAYSRGTAYLEEKSSCKKPYRVYTNFVSSVQTPEGRTRLEQCGRVSI